MKEDRSHICIMAALAVNVFYLIVCFAFCGKHYFGAIDDYFMARTLEGVFGDSYNVHLTFVNVLYGYFLLPFYHLFPKVGWYYIGEITEVFVSFSIISFILIKKMGMRWGVTLSFLFILFFARDFYLTIQFTQCSAILGAAGMLLFLYGFGKHQNKKRIVLLGLVFMFWSIIMRREAFLMGLPFFACALLLQIKDDYCSKRFLFVAILILLTGFYGIEKVNQLHYTSPEYHNYMEFQAPRATLGDKLNYNRSLVCDELEEDGFYCEDYNLLTHWTFYDTEIFAVDTLKSIAKRIEKNSHPVKWLSLPNTTLNAMVQSVNKPGLWAFFFFCALVFLSKNGKIVYVWVAFFIMFTLMAYLLYLYRFVYHVETGLWLYATSLSIPFIGKFNKPSKKVFVCFSFILIATILSLFLYSGTFIRDAHTGIIFDSSTISKRQPKYKALFEYVQSSSDCTIFLVDMKTYKLLSYYKSPPYLSEPFGSWKKIVSLGFWTPYFPDIAKHLEKCGVTNPIRDIIFSNVLVINDYRLVDFLERHYYDSVNVQIVKEFENVKIFNYSKIDVDKDENKNTEH